MWQPLKLLVWYEILKRLFSRKAKHKKALQDNCIRALRVYSYRPPTCQRRRSNTGIICRAFFIYTLDTMTKRVKSKTAKQIEKDELIFSFFNNARIVPLVPEWCDLAAEIDRLQAIENANLQNA